MQVENQITLVNTGLALEYHNVIQLSVCTVTHSVDGAFY